MTTTAEAKINEKEIILLRCLPGPDARGRGIAGIDSDCHFAGVLDSSKVLKGLLAAGLVAVIDEDRGNGSRRWYRLTPDGAAQLKAVAA